MAEVLLRFSEPIEGEDGGVYDAQACGAPAENDLWQGWIEFVPRAVNAPPLRTSRETTQPNRTDLSYWATGLSVVYLQGALRRATTPPARRPPPPELTPYFTEPAPAPRPVVSDAPRAILDPFATYAQGEDVLRQELGALDETHLRNILRRYGARSADELDAMSPAELRHAIVLLARRSATRPVDDARPSA
jgi:hypothetical protein